jgi:hypothetical protein
VKKLGLIAPLAAMTAAAGLFISSDAEACGACVIPATDPTVVTGHRMALSISPDQTVLWDQIQYAGDPAEFAWVLPVKEGARIEVGSDAFFEALEAATSVQVIQPIVTCDQPFNFGCGGFAADAAGFAEGTSGSSGGPQVNVLHRGTVGPYETVTLSTDTPGALNTWLTTHNYNIDQSQQPIIDAYVAEGFDFIALRLQPDKGVREMKPVRVVTPGANPTLPLRMVAIGTGPSVAITLFVISEGRWEAENFGNARVPTDLVAWDFVTNKSNYGELRKDTLESTDKGLSWLTAYAIQGALLQPLQSPINNMGFGFGNIQYGVDGNGIPLDTVAEAYLNQGIANKETDIDMQPVDTAACRDDFSQFESTHSGSAALVKNPCPAGEPFNSPNCGTVDSGKIDARTFACGGLTDLAVALAGSHPRDVWITRLEAELPREGLAKDLTLRAAPAEKQEPVSNWIQAKIAVNADSQCADLVAPRVWPTRGFGSNTGALIGLGIAGIALAGLTRRLSRTTAEASSKRRPR